MDSLEILRNINTIISRKNNIIELIKIIDINYWCNYQAKLVIQYLDNESNRDYEEMIIKKLNYLFHLDYSESKYKSMTTEELLNVRYIILKYIII